LEVIEQENLTGIKPLHVARQQILTFNGVDGLQNGSLF